MPVVNIEGVQPGDLSFTGPVLADIFLGKIQKWNDKAIADLNPGAKLPETLITVVHRSDGSGTTFNFTNYLSKVSPEWKEKVGEGTSVSWPTGVGGKGNEGVAAYVKQIKDSIGYVEYAYALQNKMTYAQMQNQAGKWVKPDKAAFSAAAASADWKKRQGFQPDHDRRAGRSGMADHRDDLGDHVQDSRKTPPHAKTAFDFFKWAFENGQKEADSLDYVAAAGAAGQADRGVLEVRLQVLKPNPSQRRDLTRASADDARAFSQRIPADNLGMTTPRQ